MNRLSGGSNPLAASESMIPAGSREPTVGWARVSSVRGKIGAVFTVMIAVISVFIYVFFPRVYEREAREALARSAESVGAMAAFSVRAAVVFEDSESMISGLQGALESDNVLFVRVLAPSGETLAVLRRDEAVPTLDPDPPVAGFAEDGMSYRVLVPVRSAGGVVATLDLGVSLEALREQVRSMRTLVGFAAASVFILGLAAILWLSAVITRPLSRIADTAERIAAGDLNSRASVQTTDEVGQLARSFNTMVDNLQHAHVELERANERLAKHWRQEVSDRERMENFYENILSTVAAQVGVFDLEGRYIYANSAELSAARTNESAIGCTPLEVCLREGLEPEIGERRRDAIQACVSGQHSVTIEEAVPMPDGRERFFLRLFSPIANSVGEVEKVIGYGVDITDRRQAEVALRDSEGQLRQARRMEAIGRLAGGVAHDFNNLLTVIAGNSELLMMDLEEGHKARPQVERIQETTVRATRLTQQLLAFSRKQVLQTSVLALNEVVHDTEKLLRPLIGEHHHLTTFLRPGLWPIKADPGQIEQVLMNLVLNARDAMPEGGVIQVETANVDVDESFLTLHPDLSVGPHVMLSVSDSGEGIGEETRPHIFEPFFTTKDVGKGTGLGLSTVYGIVKQSGGSISVESEPGVGATFRIYMPRAEEEACNEGACEAPARSVGGQETIFRVEDEDLVRDLASTILERAGYTVLAARSPADALDAASRVDVEIDLILSDVVMPGMSGPAVVSQLLIRWPEARVMFMSAYPAGAIPQVGAPPSGTVFLAKPFTVDGLVNAVRQALESEPQPSAREPLNK